MPNSSNPKPERMGRRPWAPHFLLVLLAGLWCGAVLPAPAALLWSRPEETLVRSNGAGADILLGAVKPRDDTSSGTLYFKLRVEPLWDASRKGNSRGMVGWLFYQGGLEKMGIGNAAAAWGYSAFNLPMEGPGNKTEGEFNLASATTELDMPGVYEAPRYRVRRTIVFKVDYVPGGLDHVTVWLNPNLAMGATELAQPSEITTEFKADASFDQIRLCHRGVGEGWIFSDLAIATSFEDFVPLPFWQRGWIIALAVLLPCVLVVGAIVMLDRRRTRLQIQRLQQARAVDQERARIAQDLHDDLGSGLTEIVLLSDSVRQDLNPQAESWQMVGAIADRARELTQAMDEIVWVVNPRNDSLESLLTYLNKTGHEYLQRAGVRSRWDFPETMPDWRLATDVRHNLYLACKEALHNVVKHAAATEVWVRLKLEPGRVILCIEDNGRGFDPGQLAAAGNGLLNMQRRMEAIGCQTGIASTPGHGTTVTFDVFESAGVPPGPAGP
jgi:signal transduction histidine kinase